MLQFSLSQTYSTGVSYHSSTEGRFLGILPIAASEAGADKQMKTERDREEQFLSLNLFPHISVPWHEPQLNYD